MKKQKLSRMKIIQYILGMMMLASFAVFLIGEAFLPQENGLGESSFRAFDAEWGEVFSQWQPPISGEDANFKVYEFSSLEKIPIDVNSDKEFLSKGSLSSTYKKSAPGSVSEWLDLNKTTDSFKSF